MCELAAAAEPLGGLQYHAGIGMGRVALGMRGNIHGAAGRNGRAHRFTAMDAKANAWIERRPGAQGAQADLRQEPSPPVAVRHSGSISDR